MGQKYPALEYSDKMWEDSKNGVLTVECDSWKGFKRRIQEYTQYKYVWRGQRCEKPLLPSIYRGCKRPDGEKIKQHLNRFKKDMPWAGALEQFLKQARELKTKAFREAFGNFRKMVDPQNGYSDKSNEEDFFNYIYWAIGQHHELETPLLDWTRDPYKALFFALCEGKEKDGKRVVFGLAEKSRRLVYKKKAQPKKRYTELLGNLDFVRTILDSPDSPSSLKERITPMFARIAKQSGIFTRSPRKEDVETHARRCYKCFKERDNETIVFLIKILIPDRVRKLFLQKLEDKEISYKKMFPDLQGAALHCNLKLELSQ